MEETENLMSGLLEEMNRAREILKMYEEIPNRQFGAMMIRNTIQCAERSIASGDIVEMITSFKELKEIQ